MILDVDGVAFAYNGRDVLRDIGFAVRRGDLLAILGPNGVGKTTLLRCMNAILKPHRGVVMVEGRDILGLSAIEIARRIGYVPQRQEAARLTAFDAVLMGRRPRIRWRVSAEDLRIVEAAFRRLDLGHLTLRHIDQMSGGELQKVAIARAIVQQPRLLLLDEPTSSLDLKNQIEILGLVRQVVREHAVAAVMTMHDLNLALRFADTCLFLKNGVIHAAGKTREVEAETIAEVYGVPVAIHHHHGRPVVIPLGGNEKEG